MSTGYVRHRKEFENITEEWEQIIDLMPYHEAHEVDRILEIFRHWPWPNSRARVLDISDRPEDFVRLILEWDLDDWFESTWVEAILSNKRLAYIFGSLECRPAYIGADVMELDIDHAYDAVLAHGIWNQYEAKDMIAILGKSAELLKRDGLFVSSFYEDPSRGLRYDTACDLLALKGFSVLNEVDPIQKEDMRQAVKHLYTNQPLVVIAATYSEGPPAFVSAPEERDNPESSRYFQEDDPTIDVGKDIHVQRSREVAWILERVKTHFALASDAAELEIPPTPSSKTVVDLTPVRAPFPEVCPVTHHLVEVVMPIDRVIGAARGLIPPAQPDEQEKGSADEEPEAEAKRPVDRVVVSDGLSFFGSDVPLLKGFDPDSVDAVVGVNVFGTLPNSDQEMLLLRISQILKPGGIVALTVDADKHAHPFPLANEFEELGFEARFLFVPPDETTLWVEPTSGGKLVYRVFGRKPHAEEGEASEEIHAGDEGIQGGETQVVVGTDGDEPETGASDRVQRGPEGGSQAEEEAGA